jgi:exonuclease III
VIKLSSLNVGGIGKNSDKIRIIKQLAIENDIVCITESKTTTESADKLKYELGIENTHNIYSSNKSSRSCGVLIIARNTLIVSRVETSITGRFCTCTVESRHTSFYLYAVYAPSQSVKERKAFVSELINHIQMYEQVQANNIFVRAFHSSRGRLIVGDLNMVKHSKLDCNSSKARTGDEKLFAELEDKLSVQDSFRTLHPAAVEFSFKRKNKVTGKTSSSRIDHILASKSLAIDECYMLRTQHTEHSIITCNIPISTDNDIDNKKSCSKRTPSFYKRLKTPREIHIRDNFIDEVVTEWGQNKSDCIASAWADLKGLIENACKRAWKESKRRNKQDTDNYEKQSHALSQLLSSLHDRVKKRRPRYSLWESRVVKARHLLPTFIDSLQGLTVPEILNEVRDKKQGIDNKLTSRKQTKKTFNPKISTNNPYWFYQAKNGQKPKEIQQLRNNYEELEEMKLEDEGKTEKVPPLPPERSQRKKLEYAKQFYDILWRNRTSDQDSRERLLGAMQRRLSTKQRVRMSDPITKEEVKEAIKSLKCNTSPGPDGIPSEFYKHYVAKHEDLLNSLTELYNSPEMMSVDCKIAHVKLLHKKSDRTRLQNYRPISLLNIDYKILARVISDRFGEMSETLIGIQQQAFCSQTNIYNAIFMYRMIHEHKRCQAILIDYKKAYDRVSHTFLTALLEKMNVGRSMMNRIKTMYSNCIAQIIVNGDLSEPVCFLGGVRQGCPLSCFLYILVVQAMSDYLQQQFALRGKSGVKLAPGVSVLNSNYADDTSIFIDSDDNNELAWECVKTFEKATGGCVNRKKTKQPKMTDNPHGESYPDKYLGTPPNPVQLYQWCVNAVLDAERKVLFAKHLPTTIYERADFSNAVLVTPLAFVARAYHIPAAFCTQLKQIILTFLSNGNSRYQQILRTMTVVTAPRIHGGLAARDPTLYYPLLFTTPVMQLLKHRSDEEKKQRREPDWERVIEARNVNGVTITGFVRDSFQTLQKILKDSFADVELANSPPKARPHPKGSKAGWVDISKATHKVIYNQQARREHNHDSMTDRLMIQFTLLRRREREHAFNIIHNKYSKTLNASRSHFVTNQSRHCPMCLDEGEGETRRHFLEACPVARTCMFHALIHVLSIHSPSQKTREATKKLTKAFPIYRPITREDPAKLDKKFETYMFIARCVYWRIRCQRAQIQLEYGVAALRGVKFTRQVLTSFTDSLADKQGFTLADYSPGPPGVAPNHPSMQMQKRVDDLLAQFKIALYHRLSPQMRNKR